MIVLEERISLPPFLRPFQADKMQSMPKFKLEIKIIGDRVNLLLIKSGKTVSSLSWSDKRNLSEKLLGKIDLLLKENKLDLKNISKVDFYCNSSYFMSKNKKRIRKFGLKNSDQECGFMAWQVGEITARILNYALQRRVRL